jgi:tetratricopeptide (TPR) repeat protein
MIIPKTLTDRFRADKVIPFVGAGVSMAVKDKDTGERLFLSWKALLEKAADYLAGENKQAYANVVRGLLQLDTPDYLDAAKKARQGLGSVWYTFLKEQIDHPREKAEDESLKLAKAVWRLGSQLVITTNYDKVLSWVCPQRDNISHWDIEAKAEQGGALRDGVKKPTVWHLHGYIDNAANLILTPDGYSRLYPEAGHGENLYKAALKTLHQMMTSHTLLFIGFSLNDEYFGMQLQGISEIFQGSTGPHYVLTRESDREKIRALNLPVEILTVTDYGPPLLEGLRELGEIAAEAKPQTEIQGQTPESLIQATRVASYDPRNPVFYVPFRPKGDQVIGREDNILAVREQLTQGRRTAIGQTASFRGLGGLGKTQLAVEYAYRYQNEYPNGVIWLNADQDIDAQLTDLAEKALWIAPESEHKYKLEIAQQRLRKYSDCLIIFDNVESLDSIKNYLPEPQANPHILITSRFEQSGFTPIDINLLDIELSLKLLLQEAGRKQQPTEENELNAAREIAKILDGLPLALELAGAYIRYRQVRWQQYRGLLGQNLKIALPGKLLGGSFTQHEKDIYSTLKINEEVFEDEPRLRSILDLLTWSGSAAMGLSLMCALLEIENPVDLTNALSLGIALRLLQESPNAESYAIHRLVREVRREDIPLLVREEWANKICQLMGEWFQERKEKFEDLSDFEAEIDHLQAWQQHALKYASKHTSRLIWLQAYPSYHRGRYQETRQWIEKALDFFERFHSDDLELKAHLFNDLGYSHSALGEYRRALEYDEKALAIRLELLGEQHPDTAMSFSNVGASYGNLGQYKRGLEYDEKALTILSELLGERHPRTAISFNNVGTGYSHLGQYKRGLEYYEKALIIRLELLGEQHPDTALSFSNIGASYSHLGQHKRALEYYEKALIIRLELLGEQHPDTALSFSNVGVAYGNLDQHKRALEYNEKALAIRLELFGERHPKTAMSFDNVGTTYGDLGEHKRALEYNEKALAIRLELFGERHPDTARSFNNIGITYGVLDEHKRELDYQEKAFNISKDMLGDHHPDTVLYANNIVCTLSELNRHLEALRLIDEFLQKLPKDHLHYDMLRRSRQEILSCMPGFRSQSMSKQRKKGKKKRR